MPKLSTYPARTLTSLLGDDGSGNVGLTPSYCDVVAPVATGVAATDIANLQAAINATPAGGRVFLRGYYKINAALTAAQNISIEGNGVTPIFGPVSTGNSPITPTGLSGTVIEQQTAATDVFDVSVSGATVNLARLGLAFASGLASTGHGINAIPSLVVGSGHDIGVQSSVFESVYVFGHDGNHYGFRVLNPQMCTFIHCHSYGGGGFNVIADAGTINSGNCVFIHPYVAITNVGAAGGYVHSGGTTTPGTLNLLTYIRPQVICSGPVATAGTNPLWNDLAGAGIPKGINVFGADFETAGANAFTPGSGTTFVATALINGQNSSNVLFGPGALPNWTAAGSGSANSAFGSIALGANTSGSNNTAVGGSALAANTTASNNTAVGNIALAANTTGASNTAVGKGALNANVSNSSNTAVGMEALKLSTSDGNTAVGSVALQNMTTGGNNTAVGGQAGQAVTTGSVNVFMGQSAGVGVTTGANNTFIGYKAGVTNTGGNQVTTASQSVFIGCFSGPGSSAQASGQIAIGYSSTTIGANSTALGTGTQANAAGAVAIGHDNSSGAATTTTANEFVLGTSLHLVRVNGTFGIGKAATGTSSASIVAGTTAKSQMNLAVGVAPTSSSDGDVWYESGALKMNVGGTVKTFTLA